MVDRDRVNRVIDTLRAVLSELDETNDQGADRHSDGRYTVDSSVSVGTVDDFLDRAHADRPGPDRVEDDSSPGRGRDDQGSLVTTRTTEDGLVIVADVPGAPGRSDDLDVTFDREAGTLTFGRDGEELGRVPLEDEQWTVGTVSVTNGILEIELHQD